MALTMAMRRIGEGYLLSQGGAQAGARSAGRGLRPNRTASRGIRSMNPSSFRSLRNLSGAALLVLAACGGGGNDDDSAGNMPPTVTLAAPATGSAGVALTLTATAADSDDSVAKVEFFDGATLLGQDTGSPYSLTWTPASSGVHSLTARATDSHGAATTSAAVSVAVDVPIGGDTTAPTATLTAPADLAAGLTGMLALSATASDNVAVTAVEFQIDGVTIGAADTSAPYAATRRHQPLHQRPARAAGAGERRRGQRLALVDGAGAVRRQRRRSPPASPATRPG